MHAVSYGGILGGTLNGSRLTDSMTIVLSLLGLLALGCALLAIGCVRKNNWPGGISAAGAALMLGSVSVAGFTLGRVPTPLVISIGGAGLIALLCGSRAERRRDLG